MRSVLECGWKLFCENLKGVVHNFKEKKVNILQKKRGAFM